jgi:elongation factor G
VWNQTKGIEERFGTVHLLRGKEQIPMKLIHAGDIASVPKLSATSTGNTLCDKGHPLTLPMPVYPHALFSVAVFPRTQADAAKISPTLTRLCEEDMTLSWRQEPSTNQTILQGMGDQHIDVAIRKAENKFQTGLTVEIPKVPYQETISKQSSSQYIRNKQVEQVNSLKCSCGLSRIRKKNFRSRMMFLVDPFPTALCQQSKKAFVV